MRSDERRSGPPSQARGLGLSMMVGWAAAGVVGLATHSPAWAAGSLIGVGTVNVVIGVVMTRSAAR